MLFIKIVIILKKRKKKHKKKYKKEPLILDNKIIDVIII